MNMTDLHLPQHGCEHLDKAFLHFFEKFRMVYVSEVVVQKASKVRHTLTHMMGLWPWVMPAGLSAGLPGSLRAAGSQQ